MSSARIMLCADDYAMTAGVSAGIEELAAAGRLSAASAMVTTPHWPQLGPKVQALREKTAVGLHINLTMGAPLGPMPGVAPDGRLPDISSLLKRSLTGANPPDEITAEVTRQLVRFRDVAGCLPDFIDGHQHCHVLPGIRHGVLRALAGQRWGAPPLIRNPADTTARIRARGAATVKSLTLATLAGGYSGALAKAGFPSNDGFSGASAFDESVPFSDELARFLLHPGARHLVMCHPGHVDAELPTLDPVIGRREQEFAALMTFPGLPERLLHPVRAANGAINWATAWAEAGEGRRT